MSSLLSPGINSHDWGFVREFLRRIYVHARINVVINVIVRWRRCRVPEALVVGTNEKFVDEWATARHFRTALRPSIILLGRTLRKVPSNLFLVDLSSSLDIHATPTFFFLQDGQQIDKLVGANKPELEKKIAALAESTQPSTEHDRKDVSWSIMLSGYA
ncbi:Thioredoxin H4-1 [Platanthera guangdongensis]|uniref:Thioredoxin H4-1 n=1 Tax=Platanthera guangdongensis TaxID=2320717 RepID=A0ABR2LW30_9ASPA